MDADYERRLLGLLGLGARGRLAVIGVDRVREAAFKGALACVVVASDASKNSTDKLIPLLKARRVKVIEGPGTHALGNAVGREQTAAVGITDRQLAKGIRELMNEGRRAETSGVR